MQEKTILDRPPESAGKGSESGTPPHLVFMGASVVLIALYFGFDYFGVRSPGVHGANQYAIMQFARLYAIFCLFFSVSYRLFRRRKLVQALTWTHVALTLGAYAASLALWFWRPPYTDFEYAQGSAFFDNSLFIRTTNQMFIYGELSYLTILYGIGLACWLVNLAVGLVRFIRSER